MRILADENMDGMIVDWLRSQGHDVLFVMESMRGAGDDEILSRANIEGRVVLTKDMDFGEMVFFDKLESRGIILLQLQSRAQSGWQSFKQDGIEIAQHAGDSFVVVTEDRLRIRRIHPGNP